jgi:hypothetical protein
MMDYWLTSCFPLLIYALFFFRIDRDAVYVGITLLNHNGDTYMANLGNESTLWEEPFCVVHHFTKEA